MVAVAKPTWLQWEPERNGARSAGVIRTELDTKFLQTKKQTKQAKSCHCGKISKKQNPTPQQLSQPKLSRAEKRWRNEEREAQAACDLDDAALATEGDPQASREAQEASQLILLDSWYYIPLFVLATEMDIDADLVTAADELRAPSRSPTGMDNTQLWSSAPETHPRTHSPSPRPHSPMHIDPPGARDSPTSPHMPPRSDAYLWGRSPARFLTSPRSQ
ncbi:hypothetical protein JAAARDRAFT_198301 [Jaapia argillacea MUCL 33604]|uniref:Uncharacterized protein n=1 Tax=Jaapia argillacea MUCL 33604 TaxID=933084 RepID=A0A067PPY2_9AGAM|nr:hypothetical protein JAAARDRAFT_198301 [Jaapia argillacea MUCL 33604]